MPLYMCSTCGCFDNTATGGYWVQEMEHHDKHGSRKGFKPLCSEHNPAMGKWHGEWEKKSAAGYVQDRAGFIYSPKEAEGYFKHLAPFTPVELPTPITTEDRQP